MSERPRATDTNGLQTNSRNLESYTPTPSDYRYRHTESTPDYYTPELDRYMYMIYLIW